MEVDDLGQVEVAGRRDERLAMAERIVVAVGEHANAVVNVGRHAGPAELIHELRPALLHDLGVEEAAEGLLPGAEETGAAANRDQAAVPVGADAHLPDRGLGKRLSP